MSDEAVHTHQDPTESTTPEPPRIAVVGGGVMGGTIITAVRVAGWPAEGITVAEKDTARAGALEEAHGIHAAASIADAVEDAEVIVIAVKPQDADSALAEIATAYKPGALVITVAAGLPTAFYESRLPDGAPVVRSMPNTPAIVARGATAIAPGSHATSQHLGVAEAMLRATGLVVTVAEEDLDAVTAVSGSGPAYFYAVVEALTEAGVAHGLDRELATQLAAHTFVGAAQLLMESGDTPQKLRRRVSSPGGTTIAALEAMEHAGLQGVVSAGANAAAARSRELAQELGD
ncbi:pyrroline-5-carboxylate reductase [Demequina sp. SO4-18]|uniref:pyrroline-5-carboxylate reductase n=1 Tax=Demequina sp. SO4-18 TaxID=3401026 RepID=UPI003B59BB08